MPASALRTLRLSATGGTRTFGSIIASSGGGAGGFRRVYKFVRNQSNISPADFFSSLDNNFKFNFSKSL